MKNLKKTFLLLCSLMLALSCENFDDNDLNSDISNSDLQVKRSRQIGAVYLMTNNPEGNEVIAYDRNYDGSLTEIGAYTTGGKGRVVAKLADPLESQDGMIIDKKRKLLFVVNVGSNSISVFKIRSNGSLILTDIASSNGDAPVTLAYNGFALYVGNRQGEGSITGYYLKYGKLIPIKNSTINGLGPYIASIDFSANGRNLIIIARRFATVGFDVITTGRADEIISLPLDYHFKPIENLLKRIPGPPTENIFLGEVFGDIYLLSSLGSLPQFSGSMTSYKIKNNGDLELISLTEELPGSGVCWVEFDAYRKIAYSGNFVDGTITSYKIENNGEISIQERTAGQVEGSVVTGGPLGAFNAGSNLEMLISGDYLYSVNSQGARIDVFSINADGSLTIRPDLEVTNSKLLKGTFYCIAGF